MMKRVSCLVLLLLLLPVPYLSAEQIHKPWADLLSRHVQDGAVDYHGFKKNEKELDDYLHKLETTDPYRLDENARLAFFINAYNGYTVKLILDNFKDGNPPESIKKIGGLFSSPWDIAFVKINGTTYTLDNIEHDIIRKQFDEPRIHFGVNCASKSCPPLISEPYEGEILDAQLEKSTRDFLADSSKNHLAENTLYISKIFKWYAEDFNDDPIAFFLAHSDEDLQNRLKLLNKITVKYLDYDWKLNGLRTEIQ